MARKSGKALFGRMFAIKLSEDLLALWLKKRIHVPTLPGSTIVCELLKLEKNIEPPEQLKTKTLPFHIRSKGDPISGPLLCEKALELNEKLGSSAYFKAGTGRLNNFKSLHGIRELQIEGKSLSDVKNTAHKFKETFLHSAEEEGYSTDNVYNVDETRVNWKALPRKSLAK
ncbi:jerky-like protein [Trichonephila clavipes]|nr:jerky-like protein [Trichonephila clavipes]